MNGWSGWSIVLLSCVAGCGGPRVPLESLRLEDMSQDWGTPRAGASVDGNPLRVGGRAYARGVGTHANSSMVIALHGRAESFTAHVGVDDETGSYGTVAFVVRVDGHEVYRSPVMNGGEAARRVAVDLRGAQTLELIVEDADDNIDYDHADWADAAIVLRGAADPRLETVPLSRAEPDIARGQGAFPAIHAPRVTGASPGRPFLFRIPATGCPPLHYASDGLPESLVLDAESGLISGVLARAGTFPVTVTVRNALGSATAPLTIIGGERQLARTPPMGWNSWNVWGTAVDDARVRAAADGLVASGLADVGYTYICIDDAWEGSRDAQGRMQSNDKFPDMKGLADYLHARGLKLGIYSSPGPQTCAGYPGSQGYEFEDAHRYAEWGVDLLKYDWCSYGPISDDLPRDALRKPYELMRAALDACGRDIIYSICQYGFGQVYEWAADVGGNYWRTTPDIIDTWGSMARIGFGQADLTEHAGPGHWNDPDMLVVGRVGWGPDLRDSRLTPNEQVTHMTLWSLLAAPLLIGCDLSQLDAFTLAVLGNPEVIEVNQDPLGRPARVIHREDNVEVWARPLSDGTHAVGLFNRARVTTLVTVEWADLARSGPQPVRDLWRRQATGLHATGYTVDVPPHGAVLIRVGLPD